MKKYFLILLIFSELLIPIIGYAYRRRDECPVNNTAGGCPNVANPPAGSGVIFRRWAGAPAIQRITTFLNLNDTSAGTVINQFNTVVAAGNVWNNQGDADFNFNIVQGTGVSPGLAVDGINIVTQRNPIPLDALCHTTIDNTGGFLGFSQPQATDAAGNYTEIDLIICDRYIWFASGDGMGVPAAGQYDLMSVLLHEFGHNLGLGHSNWNGNPATDANCMAAEGMNTGSAMDTCVLGETVTRRNLSADDRTGIQTIYGVSGVNQAPIANAGFDQFVGIGSTVSLNGSLSGDPDGDPLTYTWRQTSGPSMVTLNASFPAHPTFVMPLCFNAGTTFTFELTVRDPAGLSSTDTVNVQITNADPDGDGLTNSEECTAMTDPLRADTDGDGLSDGNEVHGTYGCQLNPLSTDTDGDGLSDADEVNHYHTNPCLANTDGDCNNDGYEVAHGTNPLVSQMPALQVTPTMLSFNDVNRRGKLQKIEIRNSGNEALSFSRVSIEGAGFTMSPLSGNLQPSETTTLQVLFSPQMPGVVNGNIRFETNDCRHNPLTIPLTANGQVSHLQTTEDHFDFAHAAVRSTSRQVIHLTNPNSNRPLKVTLTTDDPAFYPARLIQEIAPGATAEMGVYFRPYRYGNFETKLKLRGFYAQENQTQEIVLRGFGDDEAPLLNIDSTPIDFGSTSLVSSTTRELQIRNSGGSRLYIQHIDVLNESGELLDPSGTAISSHRVLPLIERLVVEPGQVRTVRFTFSPHVAGELRGRIRLSHNSEPGMAQTQINFVGRGE